MSTGTEAPKGQRLKPGQDSLGEGVSRAAEARLRAEARGGRRFRTDIQGLRAIAIVLVVLYHCGVPWLGGGYVGVDVFFVISGYLITAHLVGETEAKGRPMLVRFYARRIRRLLPPALVVVIATVVVARFWGPVLSSTRTAHDGLFAAFYAMNYRLSAQAVDYQMANAAPSPLQHFWSLAVEEQFYIVWPIVMIAVALLTKRLSSSGRRLVLGSIVTAIVILSLLTSISTTATNRPLAYYSLPTRAWELGIGALLAVLGPVTSRWWTRVPGTSFVSAALTWVGGAAIVGAAVIYTDSTPFPGYLALVPVLGAAALIAGGSAAPAGSLDVVLRRRPVQVIGHVSYGWYLWHWPMIVLAPYLYAQPFGIVEKLEVSALAFWIASISYLLVERPTLLRPLLAARWLRRGAAMTTSAVAVAVAAIVLAPSIQGAGAASATPDITSAGQLRSLLAAASTVDDLPRNLQPTLQAAADDIPQTSDDGCHLSIFVTAQPACVYGDVTAHRTILLFGDSHAEQWFGALDAYATQHRYRLVSWTKVACPLADLSVGLAQLDRPYTECETWRNQRLKAIRQMKPNFIVASQADSLTPATVPDDVWAAATTRTVEQLRAISRHVVYLSDTPRPATDIPGCLAANLADVHVCDVPSDSGLRALGGSYGYLAARHRALKEALTRGGVNYVRTEPWTCVGQKCPPVLGNTLVYRDDSHLTQHYVDSLEPLLAAAIDSARHGHHRRNAS